MSKRDMLAKVSEIGAAAALSAGTATGSPEAAAVAGIIAAMPPFVGMLIPKAFERQQGRVNRWWAEVTREIDNSGRDFEAELNERFARDDESLVIMIMASLRSLLDSLEEASVIPLARLTRSYLKEHRGADLFFRGVAEILSRTSAAELASLRDILDIAIERASLGERNDFISLVHASPKELSESDEMQWGAIKGEDVWTVGYYDLIHEPPNPAHIRNKEVAHAREVFALLKGARLTYDGDRATPAPDNLLIHEDIARRFRKLLEP